MQLTAYRNRTGRAWLYGLAPRRQGLILPRYAGRGAVMSSALFWRRVAGPDAVR